MNAHGEIAMRKKAAERRVVVVEDLVERKEGERSEMLTPAQAARYDLMVAAVEALLEERGYDPNAVWVPAMAPLTKRERQGVINDVAKRQRALA